MGISEKRKHRHRPLFESQFFMLGSFLGKTKVFYVLIDKQDDSELFFYTYETALHAAVIKSSDHGDFASVMRLQAVLELNRR